MLAYVKMYEIKYDYLPNEMFELMKDPGMIQGHTSGYQRKNMWDRFRIGLIIIRPLQGKSYFL